MNQEYASRFFKCPNYTTQYKFPLRAASHRDVRGDGTTAYSATLLAARHKAAAASREERVPAAGNFSSEVTMNELIRL